MPHAETAPTVSVILPTNRDSPFLPAAIQSVADQTFRSWELILVDNGVPDGAGIRRLVETTPGARLVVAQPYSLGYARNSGAAHARGELLVFHDDDDIWRPDRLALQIDALAAHPEAPASWVGGWHMDADGRPFGPTFDATPTTADDMLRGRAPLPHICGTLMVRRGAHLAVGGFAPELPIMEDFEYMLRLLSLGRFVSVDHELLGYRRHADNMTSTSWENTAMRRRIMDASLTRLRAAAAARGDVAMAAALDEHVGRFRRASATEAGGDMLAGARRRDWPAVAAQLRWGATRDPLGFARGVAARMRRRPRGG